MNKPNPSPQNPPMPPMPPMPPTAAQLESASYAIGETNTGLVALMVSHGGIQTQILITPDVAEKLGTLMAETGKKLAEANKTPGIIVPPLGTFKIPQS